jgi:hypothetical protein
MKSVDGQLGAEENEFHPERAPRSLSGVGVFRIWSFLAASGEGRWRRRRSKGGRVGNIDVHDHTLLGVPRSVDGGSVHRWRDRAIESRMARLAAVSTQVVETTTLSFSLCQTPPRELISIGTVPSAVCVGKFSLGAGFVFGGGLGGVDCEALGGAGWFCDEFLWFQGFCTFTVAFAAAVSWACFSCQRASSRESR